MSQKYLRATLRAPLADGTTQVIGEFVKLARVGRYVAEVMSGRKPFNAWRPVASEHPHSGEPVAIRTRQMYHGDALLMVEEVVPTAEAHAYDPANFTAAPVMARGHYGIWTAPRDLPADAPEGLVAGAEYPIHRDTSGFGDRYVIVDARAEPEVRYYYDRAVVTADVAGEGGYDDGGAGDDDDTEDAEEGDY